MPWCGVDVFRVRNNIDLEAALALFGYPVSEPEPSSALYTFKYIHHGPLGL